VVRFKEKTEAGTNAGTLFQFQSGAIQSGFRSWGFDNIGVSIPKWCDSKMMLRSGSTTFSHVSIPKWCDSKPLFLIFLEMLKFCFNSKVVRFKAYRPFLNIHVLELFQFQSGAIQRYLDMYQY